MPPAFPTPLIVLSFFLAHSLFLSSLKYKLLDTLTTYNYRTRILVGLLIFNPSLSLILILNDSLFITKSCIPDKIFPWDIFPLQVNAFLWLCCCLLSLSFSLGVPKGQTVEPERKQRGRTGAVDGRTLAGRSGTVQQIKRHDDHRERTRESTLLSTLQTHFTGFAAVQVRKYKYKTGTQTDK